MNVQIKKYWLILIMLLLVTVNPLVAQTTQALRDSLYKVMLAFPSGFHSLKGRPASSTNPNSFYSTTAIPGSDYSVITKDPSTAKWEMEVTITTSDDLEEEEMEKLFKEWIRKLGATDLGGAKLKPYSDGRYTNDNEDKFYEEGHAWRLDNSRNNIAQAYRNFTIRLECVRPEGDFLVVRLLISDN